MISRRCERHDERFQLAAIQLSREGDALGAQTNFLYGLGREYYSRSVLFARISMRTWAKHAEAVGDKEKFIRRARATRERTKTERENYGRARRSRKKEDKFIGRRSGPWRSRLSDAN